MSPQLEVLITRDGSPTLALKRDDGYSEKMHHSGGALSESFYIYHHALMTVVKSGKVPRVLSLGLGLGYNEMLVIGEFLKSGVTDWKLWSFEARQDLRQGFRHWLAGDGSQLDDLEKVFAQVLNLVAARLGIDATDLHLALRHGLIMGQLELRSAFPDDGYRVEGANCVFYDAFSKKMDPELWTEAELQIALQAMTAPDCVLATYAATGALNRVLKKLGFTLHDRPGFEGKRESTFAERGT